MNVRQIVDDLNHEYFLNTINIRKIGFIERWRSAYPDPSGNIYAYYSGDCLGGDIHLIAEPCHNLGRSEIRQLIFHEMTHQLVMEHNVDFHCIQCVYNGSATKEDLEAFTRILQRNMEEKAECGRLNTNRLPAITQHHFRRRAAEKKNATQREAAADVLRILAGGAAAVGALSSIGSFILVGIFDFPSLSGMLWIIPVSVASVAYLKYICRQ